MAYKFTYEKHAVAYPSKVLADDGGKYIHNITLASDTDNGQVVVRGDFIELDRYKEDTTTACTTKGKIVAIAGNGNYYIEITEPGNGLFVYTIPILPRDYTKEDQEDANFYNEAGDVVRGYELALGDVLELSEDGFDGTPEVGKAVTVADRKFKVGA